MGVTGLFSNAEQDRLRDVICARIGDDDFWCQLEPVRPAVWAVFVGRISEPDEVKRAMACEVAPPPASADAFTAWATQIAETFYAHAVTAGWLSPQRLGA